MHADGVTLFEVWAPKPTVVRLDVDGTRHDMTRADDGWWRAAVPAAGNPATASSSTTTPPYSPIPRSPRQPDGVHAARSCTRSTTAAWTDSAWTGPPARRRRRLRTARRNFHARQAHSTPRSSASTTSWTSASTFVELMPVNGFNGTHNWGYDGVLWYTVARALRRPRRAAALRRRLPPPRTRRRPRRRLQPPRPVRQLPRPVRPLPRRGREHLGRSDQPRGRRLRRGPPLHHRQRAALVARVPHRRPTPRRRPRARRSHRHPPARGTGRRNRSAVRASAAAADADRRERPQRPAAHHARGQRAATASTRSGTTTSTTPSTPRSPANGRATTAISARWQCLANTLRPASSTPAPTPASAAASTAGRSTSRRHPGQLAARVHLHARSGRQPRDRRPSRRAT